METSVRILHWAPRILCIIAILFLCMLGLDSFVPGQPMWQQLFAFLIHIIPCIILIALLVVAWRWELTGGIIFLVLGLVFSPYIYMHNYAMNHSVWMSIVAILVLTVPFVAAGILFILSHRKKRYCRHRINAQKQQ